MNDWIKVIDVHIIVEWPSPHNSKQYPLYSPLNTGLSDWVLFIFEGIASIIDSC